MPGPSARIARALLDAESLLTNNTPQLEQIFAIVGGTFHLRRLSGLLNGVPDGSYNESSVDNDHGWPYNDEEQVRGGRWRVHI